MCMNTCVCICFGYSKDRKEKKKTWPRQRLLLLDQNWSLKLKETRGWDGSRRLALTQPYTGIRYFAAECRHMSG